MTCDIINFRNYNNFETFQIDGNCNFSNSSNTNITKESLPEKYELNLSPTFQIDLCKNGTVFKKNNLFKSVNGKTFQKKFIIYESPINNLKIVKIDMMVTEDYYDIEKEFIDIMGNRVNIIIILLIVFCLIVAIISSLITFKAVNYLILRITQISSIKEHLFFKFEHLPSILLNSTRPNNKFDILLKKCLDNEITEKEKFDYLEKDLFKEQLMIIIVESKLKLENLFNNIDNGKITFKYFRN